MADSISRTFAKWAANLKYEDLSPAVVDKTKALILHALTSAAIGGATEKGKHAMHHAQDEDAKPDGATVFIDGGKANRIGAVYANSEIMHASSLIDSYRMLTHPGPVLVPVALANAELEGKSGKDVIVALVVGYETLFRLCDDFIPSTAARGFRPSPIYGTMGAAMVAGMLFGLTEDGFVAALALGANAASGLFSGGGEGTIHEPNAARQGVFAAMVAREGGVKGAEDSIEGPAGFYNAYTGSSKGHITYSFDNREMNVDFADVTAGLGKTYRMLTAMFRMYPTAGYNQPVIDCIVELRDKHKIKHADIDMIEVTMNYLETVYPSPEFKRFDPWAPRVGQTHFFAAHAAINGGVPAVAGKTFGPTGKDLEKDEAVLAFMKEHVKLIPQWGQAMFSPWVSIRMKDGTVHSARYPYQRMEWNFDQLVARLDDCMPGYPGGKTAHAKVVEVSRTFDGLASMAPVYAAVKG